MEMKLTGSRNQLHPMGRYPFVKNLAFVLVKAQHSFINCLTQKIYDICWRIMALKNFNIIKYI